MEHHRSPHLKFFRLEPDFPSGFHLTFDLSGSSRTSYRKSELLSGEDRNLWGLPLLCPSAAGSWDGLGDSRSRIPLQIAAD